MCVCVGCIYACTLVGVEPYAAQMQLSIQVEKEDLYHQQVVIPCIANCKCANRHYSAEKKGKH